MTKRGYEWRDDITPEQEREIEAREECARRGLDPDEICADGGIMAWEVVNQELHPDPYPAPDKQMTYEAAIIAITKPSAFSYKECYDAAEFIINSETPPSHIHCDHKANQRRAFVVRSMASEGMAWCGQR